MTPLEKKAIPDGAQSVYVSDEEKAIQKDIDSSVNVGVYKNVKKTCREVVKLGGDGSIECLKIGHTLETADGVPRIDTRYVLCYKNCLLSIVCIYSSRMQVESEKKLSDLARAIADRMK